jgi:multidrug efflux pump subunit AcrA (membrane-fusion protein)
MLGVVAAGQNLAQAEPRQMTAELKAARESLQLALANLDIMLDLIAQVEQR